MCRLPVFSWVSPERQDTCVDWVGGAWLFVYPVCLIFIESKLPLNALGKATKESRTPGSETRSQELQAFLILRVESTCATHTNTAQGRLIMQSDPLDACIYTRFLETRQSVDR